MDIFFISILFIILIDSSLRYGLSFIYIFIFSFFKISFFFNSNWCFSSFNFWSCKNSFNVLLDLKLLFLSVKLLDFLNLLKFQRLKLNHFQFKFFLIFPLSFSFVKILQLFVCYHYFFYLLLNINMIFLSIDYNYLHLFFLNLISFYLDIFLFFYHAHIYLIFHIILQI